MHAGSHHLTALGYPGVDDASLPGSELRFAGGGHFGMEISSVNNVAILRRVLELADRFDLTVDRVDECRGIFRLPDDEIREMAAICRERRIGLVMSTGPRAIYDTGAFPRSKNGARMGYRLRGARGLAAGVEDVLRAAELGVRGFLVYDEGLLHVLGRMRDEGRLPGGAVLKLSVHAGCANPASARLLEGLGADSLNPVPDLDLADISAIRRAVACPLDLFSDTAGAAGGIVRTYDVPDFIRLAAPVYLKCGSSSQPVQNHLPTARELEERLKQARCVLETIHRSLPDAEQVARDEPTLGVPAG